MSASAATSSEWHPTKLRRVIEIKPTSMGTARVQTDAGEAYLKAMGNRQGPHCLASEFVGTKLADWFRLSVADYAVIRLSREACFEWPGWGTTEPGPAFVSRHMPGRTWGGSLQELRNLVNVSDVTKLVVFDTWVRNCDRHPPDPGRRNPNYNNVYLANDGRSAKLRLLAIDHTHCFDCGRDWTPRLDRSEAVRDEGTYGLFPAFAELIDLGDLFFCSGVLKSLQAQFVRETVDAIPPEWDVSAAARQALTAQIVQRAAFVADRIDRGWKPSIAERIDPPAN